MINILYITPNFTIGGTEEQIFNLAINMDKDRFTPYVISIGDDMGQQSEYAKHNIITRLFKIVNFMQIISFIRSKKIDVVHSFYYGDFSGWELIATKLAGVKIFITSRRNMGYWRKTRHIVFDIFRNFFTDIIVANSYAVREQTILDERIQPSKVIVIYNGIDFKKFDETNSPEKREIARRELGIDIGQRVIGMISNIKNIKGYEYFLSAARIIKEKGYGVKFVIAGEGSDEDDFRQTVTKYGLKDCLLLLGLRKDVAELFSVIDIFMYSSLSEGFPNIILEAMASGKAIVSTDVGGTSEMLQGGHSGFLIPPRDAEVLADRAIRLLNNTAITGQMARAARESARQFFDIEECVRQYEFTYENLFQEKTEKLK